MNNMLEIQNLHVAVEGKEILKGINLKINPSLLNFVYTFVL